MRDEAPSQRVLLLALSREPSKTLSEDYRRRHGLGVAPMVQRARERHRDRELIELDERGKYRVPDAFLRRWLALKDPR